MPMHFLLRYILFREHASTSPPQASRGSPVALPWPSRDTPDGLDSPERPRSGMGRKCKRHTKTGAG